MWSTTRLSTAVVTICSLISKFSGCLYLFLPLSTATVVEYSDPDSEATAELDIESSSSSICGSVSVEVLTAGLSSHDRLPPIIP
ncbi:hypothetical protein RRG08_066397 [Elysia crispata]|uniref:Uncharacterized protein n=1 Tax=Elysia crispata TaxID=231223 RepID=A0AAE0YTM5_9GAST|nr:hypothetical protein RRG08_066397 [Elysia crispata]